MPNPRHFTSPDRDEPRRWTIYVCPEHGQRQPHSARRCSYPGYGERCGREMARVEVVEASALDTARAKRAEAALEEARAGIKKWESAFGEWSPKIEAIHERTATERDQARSEVDRLRAALEWLATRAEELAAGKPLRDLDEVLVHARSLLSDEGES